MPERSKFAKRKKLERAAGERKAVALSLAGRSQPEIAAALGVAQSTISADLKRVRRRWAEAVTGDIHAAKADELGRIELIAQEAVSAWFASKATGTPNPKHLDNALRASLAKRRLLGLDAPMKPASGASITLDDIDGDALIVRMQRYEAIFGVKIVATATPTSVIDADGANEPAVLADNDQMSGV